VTTKDVDNDELQPEMIWESYPERAIGLLVTRILLFQHGASVIKTDRHRIHGMFLCLYFSYIACHNENINCFVE